MGRLEELEETIRQAEEQGDLVREAELLAEAVFLARERYGTGSNRHMELQSEYGGLLKYIGRTEEAVKQLTEVKELLQDRDDVVNYRTALVNLAGAYRFQREFEKSEALYLEARALVDKKDYTYASICNNLGILYQDQQRWQQAEALYLESRELLAGNPEYAGEYAVTLGNLSAVYMSQGRLDEANTLLLEAEDLEKAQGWAGQPAYASILNQKASLYYRQGKFQEAMEAFAKAYEICEEKLGRESQACVGIRKSMQVLEERMEKEQG